jgi:FkbH-like protein
MKEIEIDSEVAIAPYGQVLQSLLDPSSILSSRSKGANVVLLRVRDWLRELADEKISDLDFVRTYLEATAHDFERAMRAHRATGSSETLLLICPSTHGIASAENVLLAQTEAGLVASLKGLPGLQTVLASAFHEHYGVVEDRIADPLRDHIAHIPYANAYLHTLTAIVARHIHRKTSTARKVVVVDCDNTLWSGVVGEAGAQGVEFDAGHRDLHRTLTALAESGVLVCLCSKNEESDVWSVFESRPDLGLARERIAAAMINWQPKSQNLRTLASRLNLGLDSFIFIDDNPVECAEVRAGCPEVLTIQWPREAERASKLLRHVWELDASEVTKEDARRTDMYREEFRRQELRASTLTFDDFIDSLQLTVDVSPVSSDDIKRASQLTLRTNQFNFTTIRRDEAELQALISEGTHEVRTIRVRDRFGDYGLVGLVIAERGSRAWVLDTFLLSCRVLGRGVEHRILADLGQMASEAGAESVRLRLKPTKRNTPARTFLESAVPEELRRADDEGIVADVPADMLRSVRFQPSASGETAQGEAEGSQVETSQPDDADRLRRREVHITRAAFDLGDAESIRAAIEKTDMPLAAQSSASDVDVASVVHQAFANALGIPLATVTTIDRLEALGCDSMRVVEITVALSERFRGSRARSCSNSDP